MVLITANNAEFRGHKGLKVRTWVYSIGTSFGRKAVQLRKSVVREGVTVMALLLLSWPAQGQEACRRWKNSCSAYEQALKERVPDEPEDVLKELRRHARATLNGQSQKAAKIEKRIRDGLVGLQSIVPPPGMGRFHGAMVECYRHAVAVLDAEARGDSFFQRAAEIRSWHAMRGVFVAMRDLLLQHGCSPEEVEAINRRALPQIDAEIEALRSGVAMK